MSEEKRIEEMAVYIKTACYMQTTAEKCQTFSGCNRCAANFLYNKGYRKQIEGKWEKRTFIIFDSEKVGFTCSECNTTWDTETKFCPNCGAYMKGDTGND